MIKSVVVLRHQVYGNLLKQTEETNTMTLIHLALSKCLLYFPFQFDLTQVITKNHVTFWGCSDKAFFKEVALKLKHEE